MNGTEHFEDEQRRKGKKRNVQRIRFWINDGVICESILHNGSVHSCLPALKVIVLLLHLISVRQDWSVNVAVLPRRCSRFVLYQTLSNLEERTQSVDRFASIDRSIYLRSVLLHSCDYLSSSPRIRTTEGILRTRCDRFSSFAPCL